MPLKLLTYMVLLGLSVAPVFLFAQQKDSLPSVQVTAVKLNDVSKKSLPAQILNKDNLNSLNSLSVGDAAKYFAGVLVKDYGGIGGLKTISVRSLGANHTGILYDGLLLSDAQGGQIDIGKLSLQNIDNISLHNNQPANILMPANCFAYGAVLQIQTDVYKFNEAKKIKWDAILKTGSLGFVSPAANVQYNFNKHLHSNVSAEYQQADGAYTYTSYENNNEKKQRANADIKSFKTEANARYSFNDSNVISLKIYHYNSERGLPGAVILNSSAESHERLWDNNFFVQSTWQKTIDIKSKLLVNAKYAYNYNRYVNPDFFNVQGRLENTFHQHEYYFSAAYLYKLFPFLYVSYSSDYFVQSLKRTDEFAKGFAEPTRQTFLNSIAAQLIFNKLEIQINGLSTTTNEQVKQGISGNNYSKITPAFSVSWKPFNSMPARVRASYKNIFSVPTFNDLYYTYIGNTNLKPEYAQQLNLGITWQQHTHHFIQSFTATVDGYINRITDKIIAVPRQNLFQWSMLNIGKADIKGIDAGLQIILKPFNKINTSLRLNYTFQEALDITDKNSAEYNNQLPYIPKHSGSIIFNAKYKNITIGYNSILSGFRYRIGENIPSNLVKEWATQDVSFSYQHYSTKKINWKLIMEINNLFNQQYEVIKYYPMPGITYRAGLIINKQ